MSQLTLRSKEADDLTQIPPESLVALCLVLRKQLQPYISELNETKQQISYQKKVHGSSIGEAHEILEENSNYIREDHDQQLIMPQKVTLTTKEDDQRLAFHRG